MIDNPWFYAVALPCVILTGISKAGLGIAGGIAVPILALVISPIQAAAIMLPILLVMDVVSVYIYRREWSREHMRIILPAGVLGTLIGWATFSFLDEHSLRILLGLISIGFVAQSWISKQPPDPTPRFKKGFFWGTISGLTSFVAHSGSPPLFVYLNSRGHHGDIFRRHQRNENCSLFHAGLNRRYQHDNSGGTASAYPHWYRAGHLDTTQTEYDLVFPPRLQPASVYRRKVAV